MKTHRPLFLALCVTAALTGCSTMPPTNVALEEARDVYKTAQGKPEIGELAGVELRQAGDALGQADEAWSKKDDVASVDHLAYLARQRVAIAQEVAGRRTSERAVSEATAARDRIRLAARTQEAETARLGAQSAELRSAESSRQAQVAQSQAAESRQQTSDARARAEALETQLKELNARPTDRGMVVTLGDVLFDTNKSELTPGGVHSTERLAAFLNRFPQRRALIEGYTDSTGSESANQSLSERRANAVRVALRGLGIGSERLDTHGYGKDHPIAGNDTAAGRRLNRRVEIVLSDDRGQVVPR